MDLVVYWTSFAENKLDDIYNFYEVNASISVAQKLVNGILDKTIKLSKNPYIGQKEILLAKRKQKFRYLVFKKYKIIYWVNLDKNRIEIFNIFDTRQNPTRIYEQG